MNKRINEIVNEIKYSTMADIGTDHGYISITAALEKDLQKIIASDLNIEPLKNCKANIIKYNFENLIECRQGSGLTKLELNEVETVIIAGMGGSLIIDILKNSEDIVKSIKQLILSPQSNIMQVRKYLHQINFSIVNEKIVFEDGIYYNIISADNISENPYSETEYYLGKILIENKNEYLPIIAKENLGKLKSLKETIIKNAKRLDNEKINQIDKKIDIYQNFLSNYKKEIL